MHKNKHTYMNMGESAYIFMHFLFHMQACNYQPTEVCMPRSIEDSIETGDHQADE